MRKTINKKYLYLILGVVVMCICGLTIVYAALSVTLNIMGNAQINSASWGIEIKEYEMTSSDISGVINEGGIVLDNNMVGFGSAALIKPATISGTTVSGLEVSVMKPGDTLMGLYEVTNIGSIPMKIVSIERYTPNIVSLNNNTSDIEWVENNLLFDTGMDSTGVGSIYCPGKGDDLLFIVQIPSEVSTLPSGAVTLSNLGIKINFEQVDTSECE